LLEPAQVLARVHGLGGLVAGPGPERTARGRPDHQAGRPTHRHAEGAAGGPACEGRGACAEHVVLLEVAHADALLPLSPTLGVRAWAGGEREGPDAAFRIASAAWTPPSTLRSREPTQHPAEVATVAIRRHHHRRPPGTELAMTLHVAA